jgi:small nuclear ribonucleoprotein (snRNP)-like protein
MDVLLAILSTLLAVMAVLGFVAAIRRVEPAPAPAQAAATGTWLDKLERRTVIVHLSDGQSIQGVLAAIYDDCVVLERATYLHREGRTRVDGEAVLPRERVSWLQSVRMSIVESEAAA